MSAAETQSGPGGLWQSLQQLLKRPGVEDSEETKLAAALLTGKPCLLSFYSKHCGLCNSLKGPLRQVRTKHQDCLEVADINADDDHVWAFELLRYQVEKVPCLVLLDKEGNGLCKTGLPQSQRQMMAALEHMVNMTIKEERAT